MELQQIKISEAYESKNNPRGNDFEGKAFNELLASVKEKGVLVPVIARPMIGGEKKFEIVAGNRRFRAARLAGLEEIPARVEDMTDDEAQEIQIIENLQREDIHPIEEGIAYRKLIEESNYDVKTIAARVGKSEPYVRYRLFLTNLEKEAIKKLRNGEINEGQAVLIAKLAPNDQKEMIKELRSHWSTQDMKEWIRDYFYTKLDFQPWLKNEELCKAVGKCTLCPPNVPTLFGEVKEGACTDTKCWEVKMNKYINFLAKRDDLLKVSKEYTYGSDEAKLRKRNILPSGDFTSLSTKKKEHCEFARKAIVAYGDGIGRVIWVCADAICKKHGKTHDAPYKQTPEEKERRKKEAAKEQAKKEKEDQKLAEVLQVIQSPTSINFLDIILELVLVRNGEQYTKPVCKRHKWEVVKVESRTWDDKNVRMVSDWEKTVRENYAKLTADEKLRLVVEIMLETAWEDPKKKIIEMISSLK